MSQISPVYPEQPDVPPAQSKRKDSSAGVVFNSASSLLYHMGRIFQEQHSQARGDMRVAVDSKLKRKIREKKIAMGHKPDDHEEQGLSENHRPADESL